MGKEKILILGCSQAMDDVCTGCSRCMVGFNRRDGEFANCADDAELTAIVGCGGCPGSGIVTRMANIKLWNAPMGEVPNKVFVAPCITMHCPHKDILLKKINAKAGCEVIEGTHPYIPENIFAE